MDMFHKMFKGAQRLFVTQIKQEDKTVDLTDDSLFKPSEVKDALAL